MEPEIYVRAGIGELVRVRRESRVLGPYSIRYKVFTSYLFTMSPCYILVTCAI